MLDYVYSYLQWEMNALYSFSHLRLHFSLLTDLSGPADNMVRGKSLPAYHSLLSDPSCLPMI